MRRFFLALTLTLMSLPAFGADAIDKKLEKILYPGVRVRAGNAQGSGTVVYSEDREKVGEHQTYVLTNHHVVARLIKVTRVWSNLEGRWRNVEKNDLADVELFSYANGGRTITASSVKAEIVAYIEHDDIALLRLKHPFKVDHVAKILPPGKHLSLAQEIWAVGCPTGVDPTFTRGMVTDLEYLIDNKSYTQGTADIIWGNSGGSVMSYFSELGDWYMCGVPSRGKLARVNGQAVTWIGYYITPERLREFATSQHLSFLIKPDVTPSQCMTERAKIQREASRGAPEKAEAAGPPAPRYEDLD